MKKEEIIKGVAKELGIPQPKAQTVVNTFLKQMAAALLSGDKVVIRGFGTFVTRHYNARKMINVHTGEPIVTTPSDRVCFIQSKKFGINFL